MLKLSKLFILVTIIVLSGCGPRFFVNTDYERGINFQQYRTYQIVEGELNKADPVYSSEIVKRRITQFIKQEMDEKGYFHLPDDQADLLITFTKDIEQREQTFYDHPAMFHMGYGWGWGGPGWFGSPFWGGPAWYGPRPYMASFREGRLIINIYDRRTEQLIWQGWALGEVSRRDWRNRERAIERKVSRILDRFPPHHRR
jgi:hypothetical protein